MWTAEDNSLVKALFDCITCRREPRPRAPQCICTQGETPDQRIPTAAHQSVRMCLQDSICRPLLSSPPTLVAASSSPGENCSVCVYKGGKRLSERERERQRFPSPVMVRPMGNPSPLCPLAKSPIADCEGVQCAHQSPTSRCSTLPSLLTH